jgi:hypothetical protein
MRAQRPLAACFGASATSKADRQSAMRSICLLFAVVTSLAASSAPAAANEPASKMLSDCKNKRHICNLVLMALPGCVATWARPARLHRLTASHA